MRQYLRLPGLRYRVNWLPSWRCQDNCWLSGLRFPVDSRLPSRRCQCQDSRQIYIWLRMEGMVFIGGEHSSQVESTKLWWQLPHD